jgi:hypothetical protein
MYGTLVLFDETGKLEKGEQFYLGDMKGKDEAWLRDILFSNPEIIPVDDIDSAFAPLVPLCTELRTDAGKIDAVFINERGRLTILECKLWRNPQARREVVAQTLDYVSALNGWSYSDLQRQVSAASAKQGNVPFELLKKHAGTNIREPEFIDEVSRSLQEGRFLVLLAGDGIREGVQSLTELVNRSATKAFTLGLIEIALYRFAKNRFAIQPRVLAETEIIERRMTIVDIKGRTETVIIEDVPDETDAVDKESLSGGKKHLKAWWQPLLRMNIADPDQEPPYWVATNNLVLKTPFPGILIKAASLKNKDLITVFLSASKVENFDVIRHFIKRDRRYLLENLPKGTVINPRLEWSVVITNREPLSNADKYAWLAKNLNAFVNVLRPRLRKWYEESRA